MTERLQGVSVPTLDTEQLFELARTAMKNDEYDDALEYFDRILESDSNDLDAWLEKGTLLKHMGQDANALNCFEQALNLNPRHYRATVEKGLLYERRGDRSEALKCFNRATRIDATVHDGWFHRGRLNVATGDLKSALEMFDQALRIDDSHLDTWVAKAQIHDRQAEYHAALEAYDAALEREETYPLLVAHAELLTRLMHTEPAHSSLDSAMELEPDEAAPYLFKSVLFGLSGTLDRAMEAAETGLEKCGTDATAKALAAKFWFQLATLYDTQQLSLQAYHCLSQSLQNDPNNQRTNHYRAILNAEYIADPNIDFIISQLRVLKEQRSKKLKPALRALVAMGENQTLAPIICVLYHPRAVFHAAMQEVRPTEENRNRTESAKAQTMTMAAELEAAFGQPSLLLFVQVLDMRFDPRTLPDDIHGTLQSLIDEPLDGESEGEEDEDENEDEDGKDAKLEARRRALLTELDDHIGRRTYETKQLLYQLVELLKPQPDIRYFKLYLQLFVYTNGNIAELLEYRQQPYALDIVEEPNYVRRRVFPRFPLSDHTFSQQVENAFEVSLESLLEQTIAGLEEKERPRSLAFEPQSDHWIYRTGGEA